LRGLYICIAFLFAGIPITQSQDMASLNSAQLEPLSNISLDATDQTLVAFDVSGRILDGDGFPLIGVNIIEKTNEANGTITDINGDYSITVTDAF